LFLNNNNVGDAGAQALARNTTLRKLVLIGNHVGDAGAQALARNTTLTDLWLGSNNVSDPGAEALAGNTTLLTLGLDNSNVGDAGAQPLVRNATFTDIDLDDNDMSHASLLIVQAQVDKNQPQADALVAACESGNLNDVQSLLASGVRLYGEYVDGDISEYFDKVFCGEPHALYRLAVRRNNFPLLCLLVDAHPDVDLDGMKLGSEGFARLCEGLQHSKIRRLSVCNCGINVLPSSLQKLKSLRALHLSGV